MATYQATCIAIIPYYVYMYIILQLQVKAICIYYREGFKSIQPQAGQPDAQSDQKRKEDAKR